MVNSFRNIAKEYQHELDVLRKEYLKSERATTPKEAFDFFVKYEARMYCLQQQIYYVSHHSDWRILELERENNELIDFGNIANGTLKIEDPITHEYIDDNYPKEHKEGYIRIISKYYDTNLITDDEIKYLSIVYGNYIQYQQFIQNKIDELYSNGLFSKLDQTTQIDTILTTLCNNIEWNIGYTNHDIRQILKKDNRVLSKNLLAEILHKLMKDGHARIKNENDDFGIPAYYCITFKGRFFEKNGGYDAKQRKKLNDEKKQNRREILLIRGSWGAGIGAVGLCLIEILKFSKNLLTFCRPEIKACLILLGFGMCIGAAILAAIQELVTIKEQQ